MNKKIISILAVIIISIGVYFFLQHKTPEEQILSRLDEIRDFINKHKPQTNPIAAIKTANKFADFVANDIVIKYQTQDFKYDYLKSKKELSYTLSMAQRMYSSVNLKYLEIQVELLSEQESTVELVAKVFVKNDNKEIFQDVVPIKLYLSKIENKWMITKAINIDPFE